MEVSRERREKKKGSDIYGSRGLIWPKETEHCPVLIRAPFFKKKRTFTILPFIKPMTIPIFSFNTSHDFYTNTGNRANKMEVKNLPKSNKKKKVA